MDEPSSGDEFKSDFNDAKFQIFRLHNNWLAYREAMLAGNFLGYKGANWVLDGIYGELSADAEKEDEGKDQANGTYKNRMKKINELILLHKKTPSKLYPILCLKEKLIHTLQEAAGKGGKYSRQDADLM